MPPPSETGLEIFCTALIRAHVRFLPFHNSQVHPPHLEMFELSVSGCFVAV